MTRSADLASNFRAPSEGDWRRLIEIPDGSLPHELTRESDDGIALGPIHAAARAAMPQMRETGAAWTIVQAIDDPDPARRLKQIAADVEGGAGGFSFILGGSAAAGRTGFGLAGDFRLPADMLPQLAGLHLRLEGGFETHAFAAAFLDCPSASSTFAFDPLAEAAADGGFARLPGEIEQAIVETAQSLEARDRRGAAAIGDGRIWAAAGASEAQELAGILASLAHYGRVLVEAGLPAAAAMRRLGIAVDAGPHALLSIAKLRAARLLHARFVEALGLDDLPADIHAETSWRAMTRQEPHMNILRASSAALAAGVGGADSVTVLPFTLAVGLPDASARRIARNSQIVLLEESAMARVSDPGAGSGTIEAITQALAEKAWEIFRAIEAGGGLLAALRAGSFQRDIAAMRDGRAQKIAAGEAAIVGVTAFVAREERKAEVLAKAPASPETPPMVETIAAATPMRQAEPYET